MRNKRISSGLAAALVLGVLVSACGKNAAELGFKGPNDDTYRKIDGALEIPAGSEMMWVYAFEKKQPSRSIGIIYQKQEVVWVDVLTTSYRVNAENRAVYGIIKDLPAGSYRLVLTDVEENNQELISRAFTVYQKDDDADED